MSMYHPLADGESVLNALDDAKFLFLKHSGADARYAAAGAVLPLTDHHWALEAIAQRDRIVIGIERECHSTTGAVRPLRRRQVTASTGTA